MARTAKITFEWIGPFLVVSVNGEPVRFFHRHDLVGTREPPPAQSDDWELHDPS